MRPVFQADEVEYYCCKRLEVNFFQGDAVVNLTGIPCVSDLGCIPELQDHVYVKHEEIVVAWPDFGIPYVLPTFWQALHNYLSNKGYTKACIHCEGGHGRTGTALAALLITLDGWSAEDAIGWLRTNICPLMVETPIQEAYLETLEHFANGEVELEQPCQTE
jgi:protein-tyrosine phosphatase